MKNILSFFFFYCSLTGSDTGLSFMCSLFLLILRELVILFELLFFKQGMLFLLKVMFLLVIILKFLESLMFCIFFIHQDNLKKYIFKRKISIFQYFDENSQYISSFLNGNSFAVC